MTLYDKLLYAIKNMNTLSSMPVSWKEDVFQHLKEIGLKANMSPTEKMHYDLAWVQYWGIVEAHADELREMEAKGRAEGRAEGKAEGRAEGHAEERAKNARNLKMLGVDIATIAKATGFTEEEVAAL